MYYSFYEYSYTKLQQFQRDLMVLLINASTVLQPIFILYIFYQIQKYFCVAKTKVNCKNHGN